MGRKDIERPLMQWLVASLPGGLFTPTDGKEESMEELLLSLKDLVAAGWNVLSSLLILLAPWAPLGAWIVFWLFAVNWVKLRDVLINKGGIFALVFIGLIMVLVWGAVAPPEAGTHHLFGLNVGNYVGKLVYVTTLFVIMFLCGSVQLSGFCASCCQFEEDSEEADTHHALGH